MRWWQNLHKRERIGNAGYVCTPDRHYGISDLIYFRPIEGAKEASEVTSCWTGDWHPVGSPSYPSGDDTTHAGRPCVSTSANGDTTARGSTRPSTTTFPWRATRQPTSRTDTNGRWHSPVYPHACHCIRCGADDRFFRATYAYSDACYHPWPRRRAW